MMANDTFLPASYRRPMRILLPFYSLFIAWVSLRPSTSEDTIPHIDKVLHAGVYGLLALVIGLAWPHISKVKIWTGCLIYGGAMEIAQGAMNDGRVASFFDFLANGVGAAAALLLLGFFTQKFAQ